MAIVAEVPARPDGLELIGEMAGSGYRTPPALVRRQDGQTLQLTPLLYAVLEAADGRRGYPEIARLVSERTGRSIDASDVEKLVEQQLRPRGLLLQTDGTAPPLERADPLLGLTFKAAVTNPRITRFLTAPFAALFHWWIALPLLVVFGWVAWWLLMDRGLASATYHAFAKPELLVLVVVAAILSAGFHEFGHAAAARRGGAKPGAMGAGFYLVWPVFYTDVTDTYRLGRLARIRTDLGGLYFNLIVAVAITAAWWLSGWDALLLIVAAQILQMIRQLTPLVRFDGYHLLSDLTGVPDLFSRIGPILTSFWPTRWNDPRVADLKWSARLLVTAWVLVVVPVLLFTLIALVLAAPRLIGTAWESLVGEWSQATQHWSAGQYLDSIGAWLAVAAITLPVLAIVLMFTRGYGRFVTGLWQRTKGRPIAGAFAGALVMAMSAGLAFAWWPTTVGYEPVQPYEGGTLLDVAQAPLAAAGYQPSAAQSNGGEILSVLPDSGPMPSEVEPALALVLVPTDSSGADDAVQAGWVFPFDKPLPAEPGDNQALAVNTTDHSVTYRVAIAMVWVTEDRILNVNEAYAFASCADCVTVAVAFQVVSIVGSANVVIPQNLSAAVNYECFECITAAIASQLVITVDDLPDAEQQIALADIWDEIMAFADTIPTLPLEDVIAQLESYKQEIVTILDAAPLVASSPTPEPSASPTTSSTANPGAAASNSAASSATPQPSASPPSSPGETRSPEATPVSTSGSTSQSTTSPEPTSPLPSVS